MLMPWKLGKTKVVLESKLDPLLYLPYSLSPSFALGSHFTVPGQT